MSRWDRYCPRLCIYVVYLYILIHVENHYTVYCFLSFFTSHTTNSIYFFNSVPSNSTGCCVSVIKCFFSLLIFITVFCSSFSISALPIIPNSFDSKACLYMDLRKSLLAETCTAELYIPTNIRNAAIFKIVIVVVPKGG